MLAVERLAATGTGFLLLVESEVTDSTGHDNDIASLVAGIAELDAALAAILDWAAPRGDTLVLVTADHDTGGVGIVDGAYEESLAEVRWATTGHTAQWVPLFAFGPGAEEFSGVIDNTEIGVRIAELLGITGFPGIRP
jgi:alkaline phosphatase